MNLKPCHIQTQGYRIDFFVYIAKIFKNDPKILQKIILLSLINFPFINNTILTSKKIYIYIFRKPVIIYKFEILQSLLNRTKN